MAMWGTGNQKDYGFYKYDQITSNKNIVNRSSAIFLIKHSQKQEIYTELHFLNYWKIKRNLTSLKANLNIRKLNGENLLSETINISEVKSYCIKIGQIISKKNIKEFTGTAEIEIFSEKNLFIPYPAVFVRYYGKNWHSGTHSTARYLSESSGDNKDIITKEQEANESNMTLFAEKNLKCYIVLHNGLIDSSNLKVSFIATNHQCKEIKKKLKLTKMKKGETIILCIDDFLNYKKFLDKKRGMLTVHYQTKGVFPRIMYYQQRTNGEISIEHSNFGGSKISSKDTFTSKKGERNLMYSIPVLPKGYKTEVDIFPTYPNQNTPYSLICKKSNLNGKQLSTKEIKISKLSPFCQFTEKGDDQTTFLNINYSHSNKLPNRFHTTNYFSKNKTIPGMLLDGPVPKHGNPAYTKWSPFFYENKKLNTKIYFCGRYFNPNTKNDMVNIYISLYGSSEDEKISIVKTMKNYQNLELDISEILKNKNWKSNYGWVYINFKERSYCNVYFFSEYMNNSVICNHAF